MSREEAAVQLSTDAGFGPAQSGGETRCRVPPAWPLELEFLACCSRTAIDAEAAKRIAELAELVDWETVIRLGAFHRVLPLLHQSARQYCSEHVPAEIEALLRRKYISAAALNLRLVEELHSVRRRLAGGGVDAIFFKGSVLAEFAYQNLGLRACTDIDLLIREADFYHAQRLLSEDGYQPVKLLMDDGSVDLRLLRLTGQCPFVQKGRPWSLDVHTALMPPGYSYPLRFETLYARSIGVTLSGEQVRSFRAEDLLQILCLHGVKNRWEALKHVCDVAELIRSQPELDWDEIINAAVSVRGERILYVGLKLAHGLLDAPLPGEVLLRIERDPRVTELTTHIEEYLTYSHERTMGEKERFSFHLKVQDTLLNRARYGLFLINRRLKAGFK